MRTACTLLLRYGDCSPKFFLGETRIGWVAFEQDFAAQAMQERKRATMFDLVRKAERFVDPSERAVRAKCFRLELREQSVVKPKIDLDALIDEDPQNPSNLGCAGRRVIDPTLRPSEMQFGLVDVLRHSVFPRERLQSLGRAQRRQGIATPDFQIRFPEERIGKRPDVADLGCALGCQSINSRARCTSPSCHMVTAKVDEAQVLPSPPVG